jgi:hypothetical protein
MVQEAQMKIQTACLLVALVMMFFIQSSAMAEVLVYPPEPDVKFSLVVNPGDAQEMRAVLLDFASKEKFDLLQNGPRAKGKLFFLGLYRGPITIIAEEKSAATMDVDCVNFNQGAADFDQVMDRLEKSLRARWPHLVMIYKLPLEK